MKNYDYSFEFNIFCLGKGRLHLNAERRRKRITR